MMALSKEESYAERRLLFKDIWETALQIDNKEYEMNKPKVIKKKGVMLRSIVYYERRRKLENRHRTARLEEDDKIEAGKRKRQRIRNLRVVCNKILEFCNRQVADDKIYEEIAALQGQELGVDKLKFRLLKPRRIKRKVKSTRCSRPNVPTTVKSRTLIKKKDKLDTDSSLSKIESLSKLKTKTKSVVNSSKRTITQKSVKTSNPYHNKTGTRKKTVRKRNIIRKKSPIPFVTSECIQPHIPGTRTQSAAMKGGGVLRRVRQLLTMINIQLKLPSENNMQIK